MKRLGIQPLSLGKSSSSIQTNRKQSSTTRPSLQIYHRVRAASTLVSTAPPAHLHAAPTLPTETRAQSVSSAPPTGPLCLLRSRCFRCSARFCCTSGREPVGIAWAGTTTTTIIDDWPSSIGDWSISMDDWLTPSRRRCCCFFRPCFVSG